MGKHWGSSFKPVRMCDFYVRCHKIHQAVLIVTGCPHFHLFPVAFLVDIQQGVSEWYSCRQPKLGDFFFKFVLCNPSSSSSTMTIYFVVFFCLQKLVFCSLYQEKDFPVRYCVIVEKSLKLNTGKSVEKQYFVLILFRASHLVFRMIVHVFVLQPMPPPIRHGVPHPFPPRYGPPLPPGRYGTSSSV